MAIQMPKPSGGFLDSKAFKAGIGFLTGGPAGAALAMAEDSPMKRALSLGQTVNSIANPKEVVTGQAAQNGPNLGVNYNNYFDAMKRRYGG